MNLQEAANRLGVHYQTAYRWVREGRLTATKVRSSYEVSDEELALFVSERALPSGPPERLTVRNWEHHQERLYEALIDGDELEARAIVDRLFDLHVPLLELCESLLGPAMREIGDAWHRGDISIAIERRATAILERVLARISTNPRGRPRGTVVVVTAPGDAHSLPSAMAALVLRDDRWKVHHLGWNLPVSEIVDFSKSVEAELVVISMTFQPAYDENGPYGGLNDADGLAKMLESNGHKVMLGRPGSSLTDLVEEARKH